MGLLIPGRIARRMAESDKSKKSRAKAGLKKHATAAIQAAFPEHLFIVEVDDHGNIFIDHLLLAASKTRMFCKYTDYHDGRGAVLLAGEVLERCGIRRGELKHYEEYDVSSVVKATETQFNAR